jgi:hypothetical protein
MLPSSDIVVTITRFLLSARETYKRLKLGIKTTDSACERSGVGGYQGTLSILLLLTGKKS